MKKCDENRRRLFDRTGHMTTESLVMNIDERLTALGLSEREACRRARVNPQTIQNIRDGHQPSVDKVVKLATALETSVADLLGAAEIPQKNRPSIATLIDHLEVITIIGEVQVGHWLEAAEWETSDRMPISVPVDALYARNSRFALRVVGPGMNKIYPDGTILVCVPLAELGRMPEDRERVIVHRCSREGLVEASVREVVSQPDGSLELWPRSHHPAHKVPLRFAPASPGELDPTIRITAIVIGSYRPERPPPGAKRRDRLSSV